MSAALALVSALVHAIGFWVYATRLLAGQIEVNCASWLMRGYGTAVLFFMWSGAGVPPDFLAHSAVSGVAAIVIALLCMRRGRRLPPARQDYMLFLTDGLLLVAYVVLLAWDGVVWAGSAILAITSLRKVAPYWPILRTTYEVPARERPGPWLIWASGYGLFGLAAMLGGLPLVIQVYAVAMLAIHLFMARLTSATGGQAQRRPVFATSRLALAQSGRLTSSRA